MDLRPLERCRLQVVWHPQDQRSAILPCNSVHGLQAGFQRTVATEEDLPLPCKVFAFDARLSRMMKNYLVSLPVLSGIVRVSRFSESFVAQIQYL